MMRNSMLSFCPVRGGMNRPDDYGGVDDYDACNDGRKSDFTIYDTQFLIEFLNDLYTLNLLDKFSAMVHIAVVYLKL